MKTLINHINYVSKHVIFDNIPKTIAWSWLKHLIVLAIESGRDSLKRVCLNPCDSSIWRRLNSLKGIKKSSSLSWCTFICTNVLILRCIRKHDGICKPCIIIGQVLRHFNANACTLTVIYGLINTQKNIWTVIQHFDIFRLNVGARNMRKWNKNERSFSVLQYWP